MAHTFVEHVGELELELDSATEAGIFAAGLAALAELFDTQADGMLGAREIELTDRDHALLLVDWLNELVVLAEVTAFVPERVTAFELDEDRLRATVAGHRDRPRHLVKAATLNRLELAQEEGRWHGHVVLDV